jgi:hypothetical protein
MDRLEASGNAPFAMADGLERSAATDPSMLTPFEWNLGTTSIALRASASEFVAFSAVASHAWRKFIDRSN